MIIYLDDCLKVGYCTSGVVNYLKKHDKDIQGTSGVVNYLKKHDKDIQDFFANGIDSSELPDDMLVRKVIKFKDKQSNKTENK